MSKLASKRRGSLCTTAIRVQANATVCGSAASCDPWEARQPTVRKAPKCLFPPDNGSESTAHLHLPFWAKLARRPMRPPAAVGPAQEGQGTQCERDNDGRGSERDSKQGRRQEAGRRFWQSRLH